MIVEIRWNGFIELCCKKYPEECCAILYAEKPFSPKEKWFVFPVDNVSEDKTKLWRPDKKQLQKIKQKAKELGLTRIGNIHSHPLPKDAKPIEDNIEYLRYPSATDLRFARRYNDIIRGILVVDNKAVYGHMFHDQFGEPIKELYIEELNSRPIEINILEE